MPSNIVATPLAKTHPTYTSIRDRMEVLGIDIEKYFDPDVRIGELKVYKSSLDGISFKTSIRSTQPDKNNKFDLSKLPAFRSALGSALISGRPAFRQGAKFEHSHIAVDASMAVTPGIGFREIIYLDLRKFNLAPSETITSMRMRTPRAPKMNAVFSSNFGNSRVNLDITSLHSTHHKPSLINMNTANIPQYRAMQGCDI